MTQDDKHWSINKHGSRTRASQLKRYTTIDPLVDRDCAMLDGACKCKSSDECKYLAEVKKGEKNHE